MSIRREELVAAWEQLQRSNPYPSGAAADVQEAWTDLTELEASVAGRVASVLGGDRQSASEVASFRRALDSRPSWARHWPVWHALLGNVIDLLGADQDAL